MDFSFLETYLHLTTNKYNTKTERWTKIISRDYRLILDINKIYTIITLRTAVSLDFAVAR